MSVQHTPSDDWKPGDMALCVKRGLWRGAISGRLYPGDPVKSGGVYTVRKVGRFASTGDLSLWFQDIEDDSSYAAFRFRKINPLTPEEYKAEWTELLSSKPVKVSV